MIERFYGSQLNGEMNIEALQSVPANKELKIHPKPQNNTLLKVQPGLITLDLPITSLSKLDLG